MSYITSYHQDSAIKALSERLQSIVADETRSYHDRNIRSENLLFNLSLVLSHIIRKLKFTDRNKDVFLREISEYNHSHGTSLQFSDFASIYWIRQVRNEVVLPDVIAHFVFRINDSDRGGRHFDLPAGREDMFRCLQQYFNKYFLNARLSITAVDLQDVLEQHNNEMLTPDFFVKRNILTSNDIGDYAWSGGSYSDELKNEIAASSWLIASASGATEEVFQNYFRMLYGTRIWPDNLKDYLSSQSLTQLHDFAVSYLEKETDFDKVDNEFAKIWWDVHRFPHDQFQETPVLHFDDSDIYAFVTSVEEQEYFVEDMMRIQKTRSFCHLLFRFIVPIEKSSSLPFSSTLAMLSDVSKPLLSWMLCEDVCVRYPFVIPYVLTHEELGPLAFLLFNKVKIESSLITGKQERADKAEDVWKVKNELWLELFDIMLNHLTSSHTFESGEGKLLGRVMLRLAEETFAYKFSSTEDFVAHRALRKRYQDALITLQNKRMRFARVYAESSVLPRLYFFILPEVAAYFITSSGNKRLSSAEHIRLDAGFTSLCIEMIKLLTLPASASEILQEQIDEATSASDELVILLFDNTVQFYTTEEIEVKNYHLDSVEKRKVKRGINDFAFEILDWGYLYQQFEKRHIFDTLLNKMQNDLRFVNTHEYDEQNLEQAEKIMLFLKSMMVAYLSIQKEKDIYQAAGYDAENFVNKLQSLISKFSVQYSTTDVNAKRIDVFKERNRAFANDLYYESMTDLLYRCVNHFNQREQVKFVTELFKSSFDIKRMLTAIKMMEDEATQEAVSNVLESVQLDEYLKTVDTVTELQNALVEIINSKSHWQQLAKPIIERIKEHYTWRKYSDRDAENLLYEINLLLAFKDKNLAAIQAETIPVSHAYPAEGINESLKEFYVALHILYNDEDYRKAISRLTALISRNQRNVRYQYHLYRSEILLGLKESDDDRIINANTEWERFFTTLTEQGKIGLDYFSDSIAINQLHYYSILQDEIQLEQIINKLPNQFLFDEEVIPVVYQFYTNQEHHTTAYNYIVRAGNYLRHQKINPTRKVEDIIINSQSVSAVKALKETFANILSLPPDKIIKVIPPVLNDKNANVSEFILNEIVSAIKVLLDKSQAVQTDKNENRYNDLLVALFRFKFPLLGWSVKDQSRVGSSLSGKEAGEIDISIEAGANPVAFIEALILTGGNVSETKKHVLKCFQYRNYLNSYFMVIYYQGKKANFELTWRTYQTNVVNIDFPTDKVVDKTIGFQDLSGEFADVMQMRIAKTYHGVGIGIYHVMIDLSK